MYQILILLNGCKPKAPNVHLQQNIMILCLQTLIKLHIKSLSNSVLVACKEAGEWVHTLSDKYGFRNLNEKYNQTIENIFLGDSYTWGACVNDNKTVQALFDKSTGSNSLNLGNVGNGPLLALATLNEFGSLFTPKSIFYLF